MVSRQKKSKFVTSIKWPGSTSRYVNTHSIFWDISVRPFVSHSVYITNSQRHPTTAYQSFNKYQPAVIQTYTFRLSKKLYSKFCRCKIQIEKTAELTDAIWELLKLFVTFTRRQHLRSTLNLFFTRLLTETYATKILLIVVMTSGHYMRWNVSFFDMKIELWLEENFQKRLSGER